ncbi:hypothetical protein [Bradyrhizobium sp. 195]|uniref:hypothetical protein n=1 Tax=Bradyrhizobium sp. 195 TaxID=2782662 RepID=UPI00200145E3|nr:hypothetical protein [Bradyrhizobium sp. 195]UPK29201.1 hypothetical protein IVB26_12610 [Bradyrhizobium sp. 195]
MSGNAVSARAVGIPPGSLQELSLLASGDAVQQSRALVVANQTYGSTNFAEGE